MAETPPAKANPSKAPTGPKVSGTRTAVSMVLLVVVLVICVIEVRAGLGPYLTLKSFKNASEDDIFKNITYEQAHAMVAAFPSKSEVQAGEYEDVHHYYWYSMLRPLMGKTNPEMFVSVDHSDPKKAITFYTSTEGEIKNPPHDPNAPVPAGPPGGPMEMGGGMPGMGGGMGMGGGGGRPPGGDRKGGSERPAMEEETDPASTEPAKTETDPAATTDPPKEASAEPTQPVDAPADETPATKPEAVPEKSDAPTELN
ncbi:MAG: hypothetical protein O2856_04500 [Planctomycetota bacterium]|nr:hypothetical protein [Planctomycetota bacterium]